MPASGGQVFVTASAELGPTSTTATNLTMQFFACYQQAPSGTITAFKDEQTEEPDGTSAIEAIGLFNFSRSGVTTSSDNLQPSTTYNFGLCAIETCTASGQVAYWSNTVNETTGSSKVVAMLIE
jgi:hypothetical protein